MPLVQFNVISTPLLTLILIALTPQLLQTHNQLDFVCNMDKADPYAPTVC